MNIGFPFFRRLSKAPDAPKDTTPTEADRFVFDETGGRFVYTKDGGGGGGTVTSVGLSAPAILSVSGSPVTASGTLALSLANQNPNIVLAGPGSGSAAAPTFRALVPADLPTRLAQHIAGRRWSQTWANYGATTRANAGFFSAPSTNGTIASSDAGKLAVQSYTTAASTNSDAGWWINAGQVLYVENRPFISAVFRTPSDLSTYSLGIGFYQGPNIDFSSSGSGYIDCYLRYSVQRGDNGNGNWRLTRSNNTTRTTTDLGIAIATSTIYTMAMGLDAAGNVTLWLQTGLCANDEMPTLIGTYSGAPTTCSWLNAFIQARTETNAARAISISKWLVAMD